MTCSSKRSSNGEIDSVQLALGTERVDNAGGYHGHGTRAFVETEIIAIGGWIGVAPRRRARLRVERLEHLFVADAMKEEDFTLQAIRRQ